MKKDKKITYKDLSTAIKWAVFWSWSTWVLFLFSFFVGFIKGLGI